MDPSLRKKLALLWAAAVFAGLVFAVARWGVDVPFWDQWVLIHHLTAWHDGDLSFAELWRSHNEHRILAPKLVMLALAQLSAWDIRYELWANVVLAAAFWLVYLRFVLRVAGRVPPWLIALSSLSVFGLGQWENWTWGWQIQIFLNVLAVTAGFLFLLGKSRWRLGLAAASGIVATLSFGAGLLFWPLTMPLILGAPSGRWRRLAGWLVISTGIAWLYFHGIGTSLETSHDLGNGAITGSEEIAGSAQWLKLYSGYISVYLGGAVIGFDGRWALFGAPLLALSWILLAASQIRLQRRRRRHLERVFPLLLWATYGIGTAMLTGVGRLPIGIGQALSSRYGTIAQIFWLGLFGAVAGIGIAGARRRFARHVLSAVVAIGLLASAYCGVGEMKQQYEERSEIRRQILSGDVTDEALLKLYPNAAEARRGLSRLRRIGQGVYR